MAKMEMETRWEPTRLCACGECRFTTRPTCPVIEAQNVLPYSSNQRPVQLFRSVRQVQP